MHHPIPMRARPGRRRRGTALVLTLTLSLVLGAVGASFLSLTNNACKVTESNYSYHAIQSVLERGVDQAMYAFGNYRTAGYSAWASGWTKTTVNGLPGYSRNFGAIPLGNGRSVTLKTTIQNLPTDASGIEEPFIVAEAAYDGSGFMPSSAYSRQILVTLRRVSTTGSGQGMVSQNNLTFKGNGSRIDSYTSLPFLANGTPALNADGSPDYVNGTVYPYGAVINPFGGISNRSDKITVASAAYASEDLEYSPITATSGGEIYGYVLIGGGDADMLDAAVSGIWVHGATSTNLTGVDGSRTNTGYTADFSAPTVPTDYNAAAATAVPSVGETTVIGTAGATIPTYYQSSGLSLNGNKNLVVRGPVVLVMTGDLSTSGNGTITIDNSDPAYKSSLTIYTAEDVSITGNGIVNDGTGGAASAMTAKLILNGTNTDKNNLQSIKIAGNGAFSGLINAPYADFTMGGGGYAGVFYGSIKAYNITVNGGGFVHYDAALARLITPQVKYTVNYWIEPKNKVAMSKYGL